MSFLGRNTPWETVFNFVMVSICATALLSVMWVATLRSESEWRDDYTLIALTAAVAFFVMTKTWKWVRNHAR